MKTATYDTSLTDPKWHLIRRFLPAAKKRGRPRTALRVICDAILYLVKTGAQKLPAVVDRLSPLPAVEPLGPACTAQRPLPTAASVDSQTVRSSAHGGSVGYDAAKKTKGRKRFLLVDTLGLLLGLRLEPANCPERQGAKNWLADAAGNAARFAEALGRWRLQRPGVCRPGQNPTAPARRRSHQT